MAAQNEFDHGDDSPAEVRAKLAAAQAQATFADWRGTLDYAKALLRQLEAQGVPAPHVGLDAEDGPPEPYLSWPGLDSDDSDSPSLTLYVVGVGKVQWVYWYSVGGDLRAEEGTGIAEALNRVRRVVECRDDPALAMDAPEMFARGGGGSTRSREPG
jgi:hypothetical protein